MKKSLGKTWRFKTMMFGGWMSFHASLCSVRAARLEQNAGRQVTGITK